MPTSSRHRRRAARTNAGDPGKRGRPCPSSIRASATPVPAGRASRFRAGTEVRRKRHSRSSPIPRSGIVPAHRPRLSDGCWCATPTAGATRRRSSAPTSTCIRLRSLRPSCGAGRSRSHSRNCGPISGSKHNANGRTRRLREPPLSSAGSTAWFASGRETFSQQASCPTPPPGTKKPASHSPMRSRPSAANSGSETLIALPATPGTADNSTRQNKAHALRALLRDVIAQSRAESSIPHHRPVAQIKLG